MVNLEKAEPELEALGFELTNIGQNSYAINGVPAGIDGLDNVTLVNDMLADAAEKGTFLPKKK
jgi:DNA mismatch repair protein MutL